jgi:serine/threonine protein kinase
MSSVDSSQDKNTQSDIDYESSDTESEVLSTSSDENLEQDENLELCGDIIKNYNVICELGRGSFSIVWLAFNVTNNNFYALKVQNPNEYKDGLSEIKFVQKLPTQPKLFNNLVEYFVEIKNDKKYLCSVWELHCSNIDSLIRKGDYTEGFPLEMVKKIMKQLIESVKILHKKFKVFHGDIKSDNILVRGLNDKDNFIIQKYKHENFFETYSEAKKKVWISKGKDLKQIDNMKKEDKLEIRKQIHKTFTDKILQEYHESDVSKHSIDSKYFSNLMISLADFGTHCEEHNYYEEPFGTRYYQAPEIILMGKCSFPVDIWAIGCTFYELLSGKLLFDPIKDSKYSRDYYHLCLINETCGNYPNNFIRKTKHYKKYFDSNGNIIDSYVKSFDRLDRKLNEIAIPEEDKKIIKKLLSMMLEIDPNKRITIEQLSSIDYFKSI